MKRIERDKKVKNYNLSTLKDRSSSRKNNRSLNTIHTQRWFSLVYFYQNKNTIINIKSPIITTDAVEIIYVICYGLCRHECYLLLGIRICLCLQLRAVDASASSMLDCLYFLAVTKCWIIIFCLESMIL